MPDENCWRVTVATRQQFYSNYSVCGETAGTGSAGSVLTEFGLTKPKFRVGLPFVDLKCQAISSISVLVANRLS